MTMQITVTNETPGYQAKITVIDTHGVEPTVAEQATLEAGKSFVTYVHSTRHIKVEEVPL